MVMTLLLPFSTTDYYTSLLCSLGYTFSSHNFRESLFLHSEMLRSSWLYTGSLLLLFLSRVLLGIVKAEARQRQKEKRGLFKTEMEKWKGKYFC